MEEASEELAASPAINVKTYAARANAETWLVKDATFVSRVPTDLCNCASSGEPLKARSRIAAHTEFGLQVLELLIVMSGHDKTASPVLGPLEPIMKGLVWPYMRNPTGVVRKRSLMRILSLYESTCHGMCADIL